MSPRYVRAHVPHSFFGIVLCFLRLVRDWPSWKCFAFCLEFRGEEKYMSVSENSGYWMINLELYQNAPSKASQVQSPSPGPHQEFIEAMTELSITVSLLSISAFLIRLSWIIRGFIYFNRHLLDSWKESLATKEQELNIIWLISHCRVPNWAEGREAEEVCPEDSWSHVERKLSREKAAFISYFKTCVNHCCFFFPFVTYVDIFCTDDVGEEMTFYIYFWDLVLNHSHQKLFICLLMLLLETLENVSTEDKLYYYYY